MEVAWPFTKWQGTGNDFIVVDDRAKRFPDTDTLLVQRWCDRHFGIGSDGLILIRPAILSGAAYHMDFLNPDGSRSFCGNGSRAAFGAWCALTGERGALRFTAIDGVHSACWADGAVRVSMRDVGAVERMDGVTDRLDTGSPHLVVWVEDPSAVDIVAAARAIRFGPRFAEHGINVNYVRWTNGVLEMRTYERGVEAETLSCGTGVTAAALSAMARGLVQGTIAVLTRGGELQVDARAADGGFVDVRLSGPVAEVYQGMMQA